MEDVIYRNISRTIDELKTKIGNSIQGIIEDKVQHVNKNMKIRVNFVARELGEPFEHLIN